MNLDPQQAAELSFSFLLGVSASELARMGLGLQEIHAILQESLHQVAHRSVDRNFMAPPWRFLLSVAAAELSLMGVAPEIIYTVVDTSLQRAGLR